MNIKQLQTLIAVIETRSFAAASERVHLSPSAVSLQIKALEDELGVQLFDRIKRPAVPTARGRALADHARKTLEMFDASAMVAKGQIMRSKLTIGAVPTALTSFLPASLKSLQKFYPELQIDLRSGSSDNLATLISDGQLDIVICTMPVNPIPGLVWHSIAAEPFHVIAPVGTRGDTYKCLLENHPFIWFNRKTWAGQTIEEKLIMEAIAVRATMEIDSLEAISNLVSEGLGISIVPICQGKYPLSDHIRSLPFGVPVLSRQVGALTNQNSHSDLVVEHFISSMQNGGV